MGTLLVERICCFYNNGSWVLVVGKLVQKTVNVTYTKKCNDMVMLQTLDWTRPELTNSIMGCLFAKEIGSITTPVDHTVY